METIAGFPILPPGYIQEINRILACPGGTPQELAKSVRDLEQAWYDVLALNGVHYEHKFQLAARSSWVTQNDADADIPIT